MPDEARRAIAAAAELGSPFRPRDERRHDASALAVPGLYSLPQTDSERRQVANRVDLAAEVDEMDMPWPELPYPEWAETCAALHLYCQIVGKYRLARTPWVNHSWHATLYVDPIGLGTGPVMDGDQAIEVRFDLKAHSLVARGRILARRRRSDRLSAFYSYAYPAPPGFADAPVAPGASFFSEDLRRVHSAL